MKTHIEKIKEKRALENIKQNTRRTNSVGNDGGTFLTDMQFDIIADETKEFPLENLA